MKDHLELEHMSKVIDSANPFQYYFMTHHQVVKEESTTTKLGVVFNASSSNSTSVSLNDIQLVGPTLQNDFMPIALRFRYHAMSFLPIL